MQDYNTIIGAIQMRLNKCPTRSVMDRFRIGSSTLNLIMSRYKALELTIDELEAMSPKKVENLFYPQKNLQRKEVPLPDFQYYYDRIHAPNSRVNISFCWLDYKEKNPDGYEKSQFYEYYQRFVQENYGGTKISMAVNRKPGEKMYIDWVGDQPGLLTDVTTGEIMRVHIFATTLGVSSMIYAEAFPNEKLPCFNKYFDMDVSKCYKKSDWKEKRKDSELKFSIPRMKNKKEIADDDMVSVRDILAATSGNKTDFMCSVIMKDYVKKMLPDYIERGLEWLMK